MGIHEQPQATPPAPESKWVADIFAPGGAFARALPGYEHRSQQVEMAEIVLQALVQQRVALVEAGTGTGKSLAYLVPAVARALAEDTRVVISTNTINLQEQLVYKDIPLLQEVVAGFKAALVKGWGNYLCFYRLQQALEEPADLLHPDNGRRGGRADVHSLANWAADAEEGSRSELPFAVEPALWDEVNAESDTCLRMRCPFYERCFVFKARREAQAAQLLVVNHHLLFADVAVRRQVGWDAEVSVLPDYDHVVVDEAHHVEDVATEHLGHRLSRLRVSRLLARVVSRRSVGASGSREARGWVARLRRGLLQDESPAGSQVLSNVEWRLLPAVQRAETMAEIFFTTLGEEAVRRGTLGEGREVVWRLLPEIAQELWADAPMAVQEAKPLWEQVATALDEVGHYLEAAADGLGEMVEDWEEAEGLALEGHSLALRARSMAEGLAFACRAEDPGFVYWVEGRVGRPAACQLAAAPIEVGDEVRESFLDHIQGAVFTSATLSVDGSFDFTRRRLGLFTGPRPLEAQIASPFDYEDQALLCLPSDLPVPGEAGYEDAFATSLCRWLQATRGRAFVLFTSYGMLQRVYSQAAAGLVGSGIHLLRQGDLPRHQLLNRFRDEQGADAGAALFGTDSFWEGVDVPGQALSCVIMARLPFRVPTDPVVAARCEALEREGHNAFATYTVPWAVLRFKQGFGRLIRTRADRGAVIIADRRVTERSYGALFLRSLPPCGIQEAASADLDDILTDWLQPLDHSLTDSDTG